MNSFDPVFWMVCALALIRIVQSSSDYEIRNWWIAFGLSAGLAFENKDSIAFFLIAMLIALLLTPQRRILANRWFAVAVLLIVVVALPNFLWQVQHHFPTLEWLHDVQLSDKDVKLGPVQFFLAQIVTLTPHNILLWGTGVLWLLISKAARSSRFLGVFYVVFLALMMALHAKDYYLVPAYPVFFAAGAVAWFAWAKKIAWRNSLIVAYAVIVVVGLVCSFRCLFLFCRRSSGLPIRKSFISDRRTAKIMRQLYCHSFIPTGLAGRIWLNKSRGSTTHYRRGTCCDGNLCLQLWAGRSDRYPGRKIWFAACD